MSAVTVRERPILFSGPMVRAILEGRKTQTRRPVKGEPQVRLLDRVRGDFPFHKINACAGIHAARLNKHGAVSVLADDRENELGVKPGEFEWLCPYGAPGDRLWVRETWRLQFTGRDTIWEFPDGATMKRDLPDDADTHAKRLIQTGRGGWRPSIHMPRWASRLTLEVVRVRVERLDVISEADAIAEGVYPLPAGTDDDAEHFDASDHRTAYLSGWDSMYARKPELQWKANPWVWVVEFKRVGGAA